MPDARHLPREVTDPIAPENAAEHCAVLLFWGHRPRPDGSLGPSCLSQWWPAPFVVDGRVFVTAEHYLMWQKASLFGDDRTAERILATDDPAEAKRLGRTVAGFDENVWSQRRFEIVVDGNRAKFGQHEDLGRYLLGTGSQVLAEASPVDTEWGIGFAADHPDARKPSRWRGKNLLGIALMQVRAELSVRRE